MAISRVSGNILQDDLQRGANLSIQGNLIYFDVTNNRVGVLTSAPEDQFNVIGVANVSNVRVTSATANGIFYADAGKLALTSTDFTWDGTTLAITGNLTAGNADIGGALSVVGNLSAGNISSQAEISAVTAVISGNVETGNIDTQGNIVATGNIQGEYLIANSAVIGNVTIADLSVGNIDATGYASITGNVTGGNLTTANLVTAGDVTVTSLSANQIVYVDNNALLATTSNLTFDGTNVVLDGSLAVDNVTVNGSSISSDTDLTISSATDANVIFALTGNSVMQINTTTALTVPVGNTAQRPSSPDQGAIRFNTINLELEVWDGTQWETVGADIAAISDQTITGDGSTVNFALDQAAFANAIIVSTNGVVQKPNVAYTVAGNIITFAEAPAVSDIIDLRFIAEIEQVTAISNSAGNAAIQVDPSGVGNLSTVKSVQLPTYTVAQATALSDTADGQIIYVSNGDSGSPCLAVYSVDAWKIVSLGGNITV